MNDAFTDRLSAYLDDDDDVARDDRAAIQAHLDTCASCSALLSQLEAVRDRGRSLPATAPAADLWSGIAARIAQAPGPVSRHANVRAMPNLRRYSFSLPQLAAAALVLMVLSAGAMWYVRPGTAAAPPGPRGPAAPATATIRVADFADAAYDSAITDLQRALVESRDRLDARTIAILERNLAIIDEAIGQARTALERDPSNPYLNTHLASARRRKLALLRRASALPGSDI